MSANPSSRLMLTEEFCLITITLGVILEKRTCLQGLIQVVAPTNVPVCYGKPFLPNIVQR
jgi:hypothetical protein